MKPPVYRPSLAQLDAALREALSPTRLELADDSAQHAGHAGAREGGHFRVLIRSEKLRGLSRLARHRLVYDALRAWVPHGIHALVIDAQADDPT